MNEVNEMNEFESKIQYEFHFVQFNIHFVL